ncbi:hypothetical protein PHMEG_00016084 [Phytophthora megakarya]|uniref:Uncharacterized protein n=1 Tax=Phytophthora megakarya TaxID=4795 RepID=A0A225W1B1_9STRA|nr:hypothetical protein PHMEG_00016084 [Phytophthora megakarya]
MTKITSFMRVTKQPKAHGKKVNASSVVKKQPKAQELVELSDEEAGVHIPTFVYQTVKYTHKLEQYDVSKELKTVVEYIKARDEQRRIVTSFLVVWCQFGCHSGLTNERRLARAYSMEQLPLKRGKKGEAAPKPICLTCATVGHTYKCCPNGF